MASPPASRVEVVRGWRLSQLSQQTACSARMRGLAGIRDQLGKVAESASLPLRVCECVAV